MSVVDEAAAEAGIAAAQTPAPQVTDFGSRGYAWYVVYALAFVNLFSFLERFIPTLLFAPIKKDFHLSDTQVSLVAGFSFVIFYVAFGLLIGRMADRSNRRRIVIVGIVLWSLATACCGLARSFAQLFLARVAVGVGEATLGPTANSMISDYFPRATLPRALSVYSAANYVGAGLALVVGEIVIATVAKYAPPVLPLIGHVSAWQTTFLVVGLLGLTVLIPMIFVREPVRHNVAPEAKNGVSFAELFAFLKLNRGTFGALYGGFSISAILGYATFTWIPTYFIRTFGWQQHTIGFVYGMMAAVLATAGVLLGARVAEWIGARGYTDTYFRTTIISILISAIPQFLSTLMPTAALSLAMLTISTLIGNFAVVLPIAAIGAIAPNQMRAQLLSIYLFTANVLGLGIGPVFVATITDHVFHNEAMVGYSISTATAIILPIVVVILMLGLRPLRESMARADAWARRPAAG